MIRILVAFVLALALAACATLAVYTDYNPSAQFASYRTYSWRKTRTEGSPLMAPAHCRRDQRAAAQQGLDRGAVRRRRLPRREVTSRQEYDLDTY